MEKERGCGVDGDNDVAAGEDVEAGTKVHDDAGVGNELELSVVLKLMLMLMSLTSITLTLTSTSTCC